MFENMNGNPFIMPSQEGIIDIDNNKGTIDIDLNQSQNMSSSFMPSMGMTSSPIVEPMRERIVNRTIEHIVPHVCPIRTKIVNHHVFRHTYTPDYSCCEENVCTNIDCGSCCNF